MTTSDQNGIDMDLLLATSARNQGLDPTRPSTVTGPVVGELIEQLGPTIIHPELAAHDLRWLAAGLDALARAAEQSAAFLDRAARAAHTECRCVVSCADDPDTACSLSGIPHVHPDTGSGTFGPCPVHPDAPGDL